MNKKIINVFENKINQKNKQFKYSNIIHLMEISRKELDLSDNLLLEKLYALRRKECEEEFELYQLMKIYDKLTNNAEI